MEFSQDEINKILEQARKFTPPKPQAPTTGRGGPLTAFISEAGGTGGALGGAALGSAILPGVGTLLGAALGGFAGGTLGKGVEQKVRDDQDFFGEGGSAKSAFTEGTIEGIMGAGPLRLARAFKGGSRALGKGASLSTALKEAGEEGTKSTLKNIGRTAQKSSTGISFGARIGGKELTPEGADELFEFARSKKGLDLGRNIFDATDMVSENTSRAAGKLIREKGELLNKKLAKNTTNVFTDDELLEAAQLIDNAIDDEILRGLSSSDLDAYRRAMTKFLNTRSPAGMVDLKRAFQKEIKFDRADQTVDPTKERLFEIFRRVTNDLSTSKVEGLSDLNKAISNASKIRELTAKNAAQVGRGGGLMERLIPDQATDALSAGVGRSIEGLGNVFGSRVPSVALGSRIASGLDQQPVEEQSLSLAEALQGVPVGEGGLDILNPMAKLEQQTKPDTGMPSREEIIRAMMIDLQTTGGQGMEVLEQMLELSELAGGSGEPNITKVTAQQFGLAETGTQALDQLESLLATNPDVLQGQRVPGRGINFLGIGSDITEAAGTGELDALTFNIADTLLRLRTGAQANEEEVRKLQTQLMPRPGDSPATIQTKLQQLRAAFGGVLNQAGVQ